MSLSTPSVAMIRGLDKGPGIPADVLRVSEILSRARSLTLPMIRRLHEGLGIPAEVLIRESRAS